MQFTNRIDKFRNPLLLFLIFFLLYLLTLAPGVSWGDSAKLAILSYKFELNPNAGYHSLRTVVCYPFNWIPVRDIAYRQNISSAFFGALTVSLLYLFVQYLTRSSMAALVSGISIGMSHTFWHLSVITESYTVYAFFLIIILWLFCEYLTSSRIRYLYCASFLAGLAIGAQLLIVFTIVPVACVLVWRLFRKFPHFDMQQQRLALYELTISVFLFLCGLSFLGSVAVITAYREGWGAGEMVYRTLDLTHSHYLHSSFNPINLTKSLIKRIALFGYQFPVIGTILFIAGLYELLKRRDAVSATLIMVILGNLIFSIAYLVPKWPYMMLGIYVTSSVIVGFGCALVMSVFQLRRRAKLFVVLLIAAVSPLCYFMTFKAISKLEIEVARSVPYRDNARYFLAPWKNGDFSAAQFATTVYGMLGTQDILISDFTASAVLQYFKDARNYATPFELIDIGSEGKDIFGLIEQKSIDRRVYVLGGAPVYQMKELAKRWRLEQKGPLWRVESNIDRPAN